MEETVTLAEAGRIIKALAREQSVLLLSQPGVGKSDIVRDAAREAGLACKSLLGTQISPEDVSGVPRIIGERSVFCPPRVLLPEDDSTPFCLFLDELPACNPDVQKAFYSLLLERRVGEYPLPPGSWVVAAGNRSQDSALVRTVSSALVNRCLVLNVRVSTGEWLAWAEGRGLNPRVVSFIRSKPGALVREAPREPVPFSTPRAWASLAASLTLLGEGSEFDHRMLSVLAAGRVSRQDAGDFISHVFDEWAGPADPRFTGWPAGCLWRLGERVGSRRSLPSGSSSGPPIRLGDSEAHRRWLEESGVATVGHFFAMPRSSWPPATGQGGDLGP